MCTEAIVELALIYNKELPIDKNNIFTASIGELNEAEEVRFEKSKEYAITGLSFYKDIDSSLVAVTGTDRLTDKK